MAMHERSQSAAPFEAERFRSTVRHYVAARPRYSPRLIDDLANVARLGGRSRVLDLGCGPGFLSIPLARHAGSVVGVDPDAAMLDAARAESEAAGVLVEWRLGSSYDLADDLAPLDLVVMGRSFHWMDRDATLTRLDQLVAPAGAVALVHTDSVSSREGAWMEIFDALREEFGRVDDHRQHRRSPAWDRHPVVLLRSPFSDVRGISVFERRVSTIDELIARALSHSGSSPAVLGDRRAPFEAALRERLLALCPDGLFPETVQSSATIARRPDNS